MSASDIERLAAKGEPVPKELRPPETMLYYMLSGLYARYQTGRMTKPEAARHKQSILSVYERLKNEYEQYISICKEYQKRLRKGYFIGENTVMNTKKGAMI
ncbi:MAG: hypothetical protein J6P14_01315 [Ruminococcus sp.]|nr:hypothetical protein [Ruminococcus sp.]